MVDAISVARGYEAALGAALGDDLEAPLDEAAQAHWSLLAADGADPDLPAGVEPLATRATAPPALARRLAQVGVVPRGEGKRSAVRALVENHTHYAPSSGLLPLRKALVDKLCEKRTASMSRLMR